MTDERLAQIRELAEKATPGPWEHKCFDSSIGDTGDYSHADIAKTSGPNSVTIAEIWDRDHTTCDDFKFITEARTAIPELLTLLDEQKKALREECNAKADAITKLLHSDERAEAAESTLSTERERVIQECARIAESLSGTQPNGRQVIGAGIIADAIRALSPLPTPPLQTRAKTWAYNTGLRLYICGVCDYAGDTEDELEEHDCHVSPPEEGKA